MGSIKVIGYACAQQFQKWARNPRIISIFILFFVLVFDVVFRFNQLAIEYGTKNTPWFLPFFLSHPFLGLYTLLGFVLLFCDAPFIDRHQPYIIIRIGKLKWLLGQILYIVVSSFLFLIAIQVFIIIVLLPTITFSNEWGSILYSMSVADIGIEQFLNIPRGMMVNYTPLEATALNFLIAWLEGIVIGCLIFLFNFRFKKVMGTILGCLYASLYFFVCNLPNDMLKLWYVAPSAWMQLTAFASKKVQTHPGIGYSVSVLTGIILILCLCMVRAVKRQPIEVIEQI